LILPGTDDLSVAGVVERIRVIEAEFNRGSRAYQVSFSIGVATSGQGAPLSGTLKIADERMYLEKFARKKVIRSKERITKASIADIDSAKVR